MELHPLNAQRKLVGVALRLGVHSVGYSPLGHSEAALLEHPEVLAVAQEVGKTPAQVSEECACRGDEEMGRWGSIRFFCLWACARRTCQRGLLSLL